MSRMRTGARARRSRNRGSVLIIVLWVAFGLVAITLYFANAMSFELRASDNRVAGLAADQAIEGGLRYASYVVLNETTNGIVPDPTTYLREAVLVGEARFWFIGRDTSYQARPTQPLFALVDEGSKLNLNTAPASMLELLPGMTSDFAAAIVDWRDVDDNASANGAESQSYAMLHPPYVCKNTNFETTDELRLVLGASMELLAGEDRNRNGVLDGDEVDDNRNGLVDAGLFDYVTVFSREPNSARTNLTRIPQLRLLLEDRFGTQRASQILQRFTGPQSPPIRSPLQFYRRSGMKPEEFARITTNVTVAAGSYILGRVNVNTASAAVLACLPGMSADLAVQLVSYRQSNPDKLTSIAWVADALGPNNATALNSLQSGDYLTTESYQYTVDVAAVGPYGRGYRRVRFVLDTSDGLVRIMYRQDLSHLGWALGKQARQTWLSAKGFR